MFRNHFAFVLAFVAGALMSSFLSAANAAAPSTHQGKVAGVEKDMLIIVDTKTGEPRTFTVNAETKILLDAKPAKLIDLQMDFAVDVSAELTAPNKLVAKLINATSKLSPRSVSVPSP